MTMHYLFLSSDRIERLSYKEELIVEYKPKNIRICNMVRKDENGNHNPFVVVDYYDFNGKPICSMPYFGDHIINPFLEYNEKKMNLPDNWYEPQLLQYITVNLNRPAYRLLNHTDVLLGHCTLQDVYSPAMDQNGHYIKKKSVTFVMTCVKDNETGSISRVEDVQFSFNRYFSYCFEYELGSTRNRYLESLRNY